jgi:leucyl-tRNA synthetase
MINQGMILGRSNFVYRIQGTNTFVSKEIKNQHKTQRLHVDINLVENDILNVEGFKAWRSEFADAEFLLNEKGEYVCGHEVEKMSKSKFNVQTPDELVDRYGADTVRCYEMFLGPLTQHKPWDTQGISGVHNFLRKFTRLYENVSHDKASDEQQRILHKTIAKVTDDLERHAFNTVISALMIAVNELTEQKCSAAEVLQPMAVLLSPQAPHLAAELYERSGGQGSVLDAVWPEAQEKWLKADETQYPVSFNGKVRFQFTIDATATPQEVEAAVLADERTQKQLENKTIRKVIVVPGRIVNIVC